MAKYTNMTETEFNTIKALQTAGCSARIATKATGRSGFTVGAIFKADDFHTYKDNVTSKWKNNPAYLKRQAENAPVQVSVLDEFEQLINDTPALSTPEVHMERIATALERLADAWENSPKKRSLF